MCLSGPELDLNLQIVLIGVREPGTVAVPTCVCTGECDWSCKVC